MGDQEQPSIDTLFAISYVALIERTHLKVLANSVNGYTVIPNLSNIDSVMREVIYAMMNTHTLLEDVCSMRAHILQLFMEISKSIAANEQYTKRSSTTKKRNNC